VRPPVLGARVLVADADPALGDVLVQALEARGHRVTRASSGAESLAALRRIPLDIALLDIRLPSPDGLELLRAIADDAARPEIVITTGESSVDAAVQAMRLGALAYLSKPYRMAELEALVARALERRRLVSAHAVAQVDRARLDAASPLLTRYAPLRAVLAVADQVAEGEGPVVLSGPAGVGKRALALAMHRRSPRAHASFVTLDRGDLASPQAAVALFGQLARGSAASVTGALSMAGTVFLADLSALELALQRRLARALETAAFRPEGGVDPVPVRARLMVAVRAPLDTDSAMVHPELVRQLGDIRLELPALAVRPDDIVPMAESYVAVVSGGTRTLGPDAADRLRAHHWPGNVSELRGVLDVALAVSPRRVLEADDLVMGTPLTQPLAAVERRHIVAVLEATGWHQGRAAEALGISPKTLYRKIREFGLRRPAREGRS
jgi:DNA-binding NtrC family response regulator